MIHARLLVEREVVQGKRDEEAFNRVFGQSLHYSFFFLLFSFSAFYASESCKWARKVETMVWRFEGADVWCMVLSLASMPRCSNWRNAMSGEEGSKENLVGLDVGDRPLFVQVSFRILTGLRVFTPIYRKTGLDYISTKAKFKKLKAVVFSSAASLFGSGHRQHSSLFLGLRLSRTVRSQRSGCAVTSCKAGREAL